MLLTVSAGLGQTLPPALPMGSLLACKIWWAIFSAETVNHVKKSGGHMLLLGRDRRDLGLVWLLSPLS